MKWSRIFCAFMGVLSICLVILWCMEGKGITALGWISSASGWFLAAMAVGELR